MTTTFPKRHHGTLWLSATCPAKLTTPSAADLFTALSVQQRCPPPNAYVAVNYRDWWFYIDNSDNDSKMTFNLMRVMIRLNLLAQRRGGGPALTLPVGR